MVARSRGCLFDLVGNPSPRKTANHALVDVAEFMGFDVNPPSDDGSVSIDPETEDSYFAALRDGVVESLIFSELMLDVNDIDDANLPLEYDTEDE